MDNPNFLLEIDFRLKPLKEWAFRQYFDGLTADQPKTEIYENVDSPGRLLLVSKWTTLHELESYLASDKLRVLIGGMNTLGTVRDVRTLDLSSEAGEDGRRYRLRKRRLAREPRELR